MWCYIGPDMASSVPLWKGVVVYDLLMMLLLMRNTMVYLSVLHWCTAKPCSACHQPGPQHPSLRSSLASEHPACIGFFCSSYKILYLLWNLLSFLSAHCFVDWAHYSLKRIHVAAPLSGVSTTALSLGPSLYCLRIISVKQLSGIGVTAVVHLF